MNNAPVSFWPTPLPPIAEPAAVQLLREQARLLGGQTEGKFEGVVREYAEFGTIFYSLNLRAPALGDHLYKILELGIPATLEGGRNAAMTVQDAFGGPSQVIESDEAFRDWLHATLSSDAVRTTLGTLSRLIEHRLES